MYFYLYNSSVDFCVIFFSHFRDLEIPNEEWGESEACLIANPEHVKLRSFSTNIHRYAIWSSPIKQA